MKALKLIAMMMITNTIRRKAIRMPIIKTTRITNTERKKVSSEIFLILIR